MGFGGYLTTALAKLVFRAGCRTETPTLIAQQQQFRYILQEQQRVPFAVVVDGRGGDQDGSITQVRSQRHLFPDNTGTF